MQTFAQQSARRGPASITFAQVEHFIRRMRVASQGNDKLLFLLENAGDADCAGQSEQKARMSRFLFDVEDGDSYNRDKDGINLTDIRCMRDVAVFMVDEIAGTKNRMHPTHSVSVVVRDAADVVVYRSDHLG